MGDLLGWGIGVLRAAELGMQRRAALTLQVDVRKALRHLREEGSVEMGDEGMSLTTSVGPAPPGPPVSPPATPAKGMTALEMLQVSGDQLWMPFLCAL